MTAINIIAEFNSEAPVYMQYAGQCQAQDAFIALDADGDVYADFSGEIGNAVPASVWNGLDKRISISPFASGYGLQQLFNDAKFLSAVNRYYDGRTTGWDGNNWTSELSEDAEAALEEMQSMADELEQLNIYNAEDWIASVSRSELQAQLLEAGSVQAFYNEQLLCSDADQYLAFDADGLAEALACRFVCDADYIAAIDILAAHDPDYRYLLDVEE